jgi:hypothetical protein
MKSRKIIGLALALGAAGLLLMACPSTTAPITSASIDSIGWWMENTPSDMNPDAHLSCVVDIYLSGSFSASNITSAKIENDNSVWIIEAPSSKYHSNGRYIEAVFIYGSATSYSSFPLGTFSATVGFANGSTAKSTFSVGAPGKQSTPYTTVATEDVTIVNTCPALKRATVSTGSILDKTNSVATLSFSVTDNAVHSGYVLFYDSNANLVGISKRFYDISTKTLSNIVKFGTLNSGTTDLSIGLADIDSASTDSSLSTTEFANISYCRVVLIDGAQYSAETNSTWDYKSYSGKSTFSAN